MQPCSTPTWPAVMVAPCRPVAMPSPPGSTPTMRTFRSPMKGWNRPIALEPPPTHATRTSGSRFSARRAWRFVSWPMTVWKSRTIIGYGCGPSADPSR